MPLRVRTRVVAVGAAVLAVLALAPATRADATDPAPPDPPAGFSVLSDATGGLSIGWDPAVEHGSPVTGYQLEWSTDDRTTWADLGAQVLTTSTTMAAPPAGKFYFYRVIAESAAGPSAPSNDNGFLTHGTSTQRFVIHMQDGAPLTHGRIQWSDGYGTWSATSYNLSPDGVLSLPDVPAGAGMLLRVREAVLPSGMLVTKEWSVDFGTDTQTLLVPPPPPMLTRKITTVLPNGVPVVTTIVDIESPGGLMHFVYGDDGFFYSALNIANTTGTTGTDGSLVLHGWSSAGLTFIPPLQYPYPQEAVNLDYSDAVLAQSGTFLLTGPETTIVMDPMPWFTTTEPDPTAPGDMTPLIFKVHQTSGTSLAGRSVTVKPPAGWSSNRCSQDSTLTGTTNKYGRVRLSICGSKSGTFKVHTGGAVPTGAVTVRVRHTAPMAPTSASAQSTAKGQLSIRWQPPAYAGDVRVTAYRLTATAPAATTRTFVLRRSEFGAGLEHTFRNLARAKLWKVSIRAVNSYGAGDATARSARVL